MFQNDDSEEEVANEDHMILEVLQKIESTIRFKSSKKELDLITVTEVSMMEYILKWSQSIDSQ